MNSKASTLKNLISQSEGRYFGVEFIKRTNGTRRKMCGRLKIAPESDRKGLAFSPDSKNLMVVWDVNKKAYRMINLEQVLKLHVNGLAFDIK